MCVTVSGFTKPFYHKCGLRFLHFRIAKAIQPQTRKFCKRTLLIKKSSLTEFSRNRLVQFFWRAYPQAHSWQGIDTALNFSPILAGTPSRPSQYCLLTLDRWSSFLSPEKYWEGVKIFHAESRRLILSGLIFRLEWGANYRPGQNSGQWDRLLNYMY